MKEKEYIELSESQTKNAELFHITGVGPVLALRDREDKEPSYFKGKYITWNNLIYLVTGVECFVGLVLMPYIGLVLRLIKEDKDEL